MVYAQLCLRNRSGSSLAFPGRNASSPKHPLSEPPQTNGNSLFSNQQLQLWNLLMALCGASVA